VWQKTVCSQVVICLSTLKFKLVVTEVPEQIIGLMFKDQAIHALLDCLTLENGTESSPETSVITIYTA